MEKIISGVNLYRTDFGYGNCSDTTFKKCFFCDTKFDECLNLENCTFVDCVFTSTKMLCDPTGAKFIDCGFSDFKFSKYTNVLFEDCSFDKCDFCGTELTNVIFENVKFEMDYDGTNISNCFWSATLNNCKFKNADLNDCDFEGAHLTNCEFTGEIKIGCGGFCGAIFDNVTVPDDAIEKLSNQRIYSKVEFWSPAQNGKEV